MYPRPPLQGSCHCGKLQLQFHTKLLPAQMQPRACDCSFCQKHGAAYVSDPQGRLQIVGAASSLHTYVQGSQQARFLLCAECGVLLAVVYEEGPQRYGALNLRCLDAQAEFAAAQTASPQKLSAQQKTERWKQLWVAGVELPAIIAAPQ